MYTKGLFKNLVEGYETGADVEATSRRLSKALGAGELKNVPYRTPKVNDKKAGRPQRKGATGSARDRLTAVMHKVKARAGGGGGTTSKADTKARESEARGHEEGWFAGRAKKRGGSLSRADAKDRASHQDSK